MPDTVNATPFYLNQQPIGEPWGNNMPRLIRLDDDIARYYVGNRTDFDLPLSGGRGAGFFIWTGGMVIVLTTFGAMVLVAHKRKRVGVV